MIKVLLSVLFLLITADARENPFFPSAGEKDIIYTTNEDRSLPKLKRATISLPPQARAIQNVTVTYKNLDGSLENKTIELNHAVDWHIPLFISQSYSKDIGSDNKQIQKKVEKKNKKFEKIAQIPYASFYSAGKTLKVLTQDKMIRNFLLVQPHRIVLDFEKDVHLKTYLKENKNNIFKKIRIGNHSGYYRAVIELDGYYRYNMNKTSEGYTFTLN